MNILTRRRSLFSLLSLAYGGAALSGCGNAVEPATAKDKDDAVKCAAAQAKCAAEAKTLEESKACRDRVRAVCNDGGAPKLEVTTGSAAGGSGGGASGDGGAK